MNYKNLLQSDCLAIDFKQNEVAECQDDKHSVNLHEQISTKVLLHHVHFTVNNYYKNI
jgi:hypothetical protein